MISQLVVLSYHKGHLLLLIIKLLNRNNKEIVVDYQTRTTISDLHKQVVDFEETWWKQLHLKLL